MKRFLLLAAVLVGCADNSLGEPRQLTPAPTTPNFTLFVSNQSFEIDQVDISVRIDGELAVVGDFDVGSQHTWLPFGFELAPGTHTIEVTANAGTALLGDEMAVTDEHDYAIVSFWSGDEARPEPYLDYMFRDDEPAFD